MKNIIQNKAKTLLQVIKFFYGKYTKEVIIRDILFVVVTVSEMTAITVSGKFLDATLNLISNSDSFDIYGYLRTDSFYFLCISLLLWIFVTVGNNIRIQIHQDIAEKVWKDTSLSVITKISNSNLQDIEKPKLQNLMDYIPNYSIDNLISSFSSFSNLVYQLVRGITALAILYSHLGPSVLVLVLFVFPEVLLSHFNRKLIQMYNDRKVDSLKLTNYIYYTLATDIGNFNELRVDNTYDYLRKKYTWARNGYLRGLFRRRKHFRIDKIFGAVIGQLFKYIYLIYLVAYAIINKVSIGIFSALFGYVNVVYGSSFEVFNTIALLDNRLSYASKYFEFINHKGFGDENHGYAKLSKGAPELELLKLDFAYPDEPEKKVLENLSLTIKAGEKVAFFGGDGSGKSSIIKLLSGLYMVNSGDYLIGGYSIKELDRGQLKRKISVTFQSFVNYSFSIKENITLAGKKRLDEKLYKEVKKICEIDKFMKREGLTDDLKLGKYLDGKELSPGYWQRLAIARMLYRNRDIFILDEPFTFIDGPSREKIMKGILKFAGAKRTVILISRDTDVLDMFDHIYVIEKGHITERGDWKKLLKKRGKFYEEVKYNR